MIEKSATVVNKLGIHARAAAKLVGVASQFRAQLEIEKEGKRANAKSIMSVMMLAASKGVGVEVVARGDDAADAVDAIERLIAGRFGEPE